MCCFALNKSSVAVLECVIAKLVNNVHYLTVIHYSTYY